MVSGCVVPAAAFVEGIEGREIMFFLDPFPRLDTGNEDRGDPLVTCEDCAGLRLDDGSLKAPRPDRVI